VQLQPAFNSHAEQRKAVRRLMTANEGFCQIYHRVDLIGRCTLPARGPAILVSNHVSGLDPLLIQSVCPRMIVWMMAREYYNVKPLSWIFRTVEAIPVDRSGRDLAATRAAMRALEAQRILGVFPEGRIETSSELLEFQTGVALLAIKAGVDVYPAYLDGTQRGKEMLRAFALPNRARLIFGPSIPLDRSKTDRESLQAATARIAEAVNHLRKLLLKQAS
jgi:1-acyl-sn-glycerol-3-phosphate acyltransferase